MAIVFTYLSVMVIQDLLQNLIHWLEIIKDHIVGSLNIEKEDFDSVPFKPEGGLGKAYHEDLWSIMDELPICAHAYLCVTGRQTGSRRAGRNEVLAA